MADRNEIANKMNNLAYDLFQQEVRSRIDSSFGLCSSCAKFSVRKTSYYDEEVWCAMETPYYSPHIRPNRNNPIKECSQYSRRGEMSMWTMASMAILIDVTPKVKAGFIDSQKFDVRISRPEDERED